MKIVLLGIAIILFGIALIITSTGSATGIGLIVSFLGLIVSFIGAFIKEKNNKLTKIPYYSKKNMRYFLFAIQKYCELIK